MKELAIHHLPGDAHDPAQVRVSFRTRPEAQPQVREVPFAFEVTPEQQREIQWYLEEYLLFPWGEFRTRAARIEETLADLGAALFEAIFRDPQTAALYARVQDDLPNTRVVIHADHPSGIALPWELLRDPVRGEYGELARQAYAFVRSQPERKFEAPPPIESDTFNILMVISRPGGPERDIPFQSVVRPMLELFRTHRQRICLDILRPPSFEQLAKHLDEHPGVYHVLHFDGHGTFPEARDRRRYYGEEGPQGHLAFEGENGGHRLVSGTELGTLLADRKLPVVLLNACQSGMTHPEALFPSVANQLLDAGVAGVVAMAYSVYVQTATRFMARLYEALINGEELVRAVSLGREALRAHPQRTSPIGEVPLQDWLVPVVYEAAVARPVARPAGGVQLDPNLLKDEQARAGSEVGTPDPPAHGFVGRDGPILELERAFQTETIVLLQGMAGVGKTETAVAFARWRAETGALDGPIFHFSFEHHLPLAHVCDRVGQVFQPLIKQQLGQEWHLLDADRRRRVAVAVLKRVPCLLIWDNFEPVAGFPAGTPSAWTKEEHEDLRDFLVALRGGQTKALITSRRHEPWLGSVYRRVTLGGLKLLEAQELAARILQRVMTAEQIAALDDYTVLLRYLGGNPLALQVILPELAARPPEELLTALQSGEAKLSGDDPEQGRTRSLAASLTYRLEGLDATVRRRLGVLGLFQGFVSAHVLAWLCQSEDAPELLAGLDRDAWLVILNAAAEVGLLRDLGGGCFRAHPALPWFFHELMTESLGDRLLWLEQAFATANAGYGRCLFQQFQRQPQLAMGLLAVEEGNLLWALRLARRHALWEAVEGILYGVRQLWMTQGRWVEWERLVGELEAEVTGESGGPLPGREAPWWALLGHQQEIAYYRRDFAAQEAICRRLLERCASVRDERNEAVLLHQLGVIAAERRQFGEAEVFYRRSLVIEEWIGDEHGQASTLHQLGMIAQERRQFGEAEVFYRQSLAIKERIGDEHGQAITLNQLAVVPVARGDLTEAARFLRQAAAMFERIDDSHHRDQVLANLRLVEEGAVLAAEGGLGGRLRGWLRRLRGGS